MFVFLYLIYYNITFQLYFMHSRGKTMKPHVLWLDNFSKIIARSVPSIRDGVYSQCLWTGVALFTHPNVQIDTSIQKIDNKIVPAMPDTLFVHKASVLDTIMFVFQKLHRL